MTEVMNWELILVAKKSSFWNSHSPWRDPESITFTAIDRGGEGRAGKPLVRSRVPR